MDQEPLPDDEPGRLEAVRRLALIGSAPEPAFDRLVRLATTLLNVPIAWISLVEADRSWFKARVGLDLGETSRAAAFCSHTIAEGDGDLFMVPDAWMDERFENNPLVIGSPRIRFYAGCAVHGPDGHPVGTLSVVDREPRNLTGRERLALLDLAALVEELIGSRAGAGTADGGGAGADVLAGLDVTAELGYERGLPQFATDPQQVARLESELEAAHLMLEHTMDVIVVLDEAAQIKFASPSFERQLGHIAGVRHPEGALALVHADDRAVARARITAAMADDAVADAFNLRVLTAAGSIRNMECTAQSLFATRSVGGVVLTMRDVSDRHLLSQMLAFQSTHDRLTELPNRMLFQEHLTPALARSRRDRRPVAVCTLDVAGFQELNDQLGHAAGDELLVDVAKRIRSSIRNGDSAARLGGDEFAVLLDPVTDAVEAQRVAERLVAAISGPHSLRAGVSDCGANAGIAISGDADDATAIIARASRALSQAKRAGTGHVVMAAFDGQLVQSAPVDDGA